MLGVEIRIFLESLHIYSAVVNILQLISLPKLQKDSRNLGKLSKFIVGNHPLVSDSCIIPNKCLFYLFLNTSCAGDSTALQNNPSQYLITFMFTFFPTGYPKSFLLQFKPITSCSTCTRT